MDIAVLNDDLTLILMSAILTLLGFEIFLKQRFRTNRFLWLMLGVLLGYYSAEILSTIHLFPYIEYNAMMNRMLSVFKMALMVLGYIFVLKEFTKEKSLDRPIKNR